MPQLVAADALRSLWEEINSLKDVLDPASVFSPSVPPVVHSNLPALIERYADLVSAIAALQPVVALDDADVARLDFHAA